jgi:hypothetical protein
VPICTAICNLGCYTKHIGLVFATLILSFVGDQTLPPNADRNRAATTNWEAKADLPCRHRVLNTNHCRNTAGGALESVAEKARRHVSHQ